MRTPVRAGGSEQSVALSLDRAAGLTLDAATAARGLDSWASLPAPHRRLVRRALAALENAQQLLYDASLPWP